MDERRHSVPKPSRQCFSKHRGRNTAGWMEVKIPSYLISLLCSNQNLSLYLKAPMANNERKDKKKKKHLVFGPPTTPRRYTEKSPTTQSMADKQLATLSDILSIEPAFRAHNGGVVWYQVDVCLKAPAVSSRGAGAENELTGWRRRRGTRSEGRTTCHRGGGI